MKNRLLDIPERLYVEEARATTGDKKAYMKLSVLVMLDEGHTQEVVATALGISSGTVHNCKSKYHKDGLAAYLDQHYVPYQGRLDDEQLSMLDQEVSSGLYRRCEEVAAWIEARFEIVYTPGAVRAILSKLGFVYKKTTQVPGGLDAAEQAGFLSELEPFIAEIEPETEVLYFMDAVHPQHNTRADYAWIKRGEQKQIKSNSGRRRVNINGAMNAHRPEEVQVVQADTINAQTTVELLEKLLQTNPDKTVYVIADNARYYQNKELQTWLEDHPKLQLIHLPAYSPNLNLIERLWKFMRKKVVSLHYYDTFEAFKRAILEFFEKLHIYRDELVSLMAPNFQRFHQLEV